MRLSEARDLGDVDRYQFYEHLKVYTAAPPDVLRVDEKYLREYNTPNCCGIVITTNYKTDGIYLPADDRRHFVAWANLTKEDFEDNYWRRHRRAGDNRDYRGSAAKAPAASSLTAISRSITVPIGSTRVTRLLQRSPRAGK